MDGERQGLCMRVDTMQETLLRPNLPEKRDTTSRNFCLLTEDLLPN